MGTEAWERTDRKGTHRAGKAQPVIAHPSIHSASLDQVVYLAEFSQVMISRGSGQGRAGQGRAVATLPPGSAVCPFSPVTCAFTVTVAVASGRQRKVRPVSTSRYLVPARRQKEQRDKREPCRNACRDEVPENETTHVRTHASNRDGKRRKTKQNTMKQEKQKQDTGDDGD